MKSQQTVGGPHRKLHLLGNTQTLQQALQNDSPSRKKNPSQKRQLSQLATGSHTPTNLGNTLGSGRSTKTPTKKSGELVTSPSASPPPQGHRNQENPLKSSVSMNQISYSVILTGPSVHQKSYQPVLKKDAPVGFTSKTPGHVRRSTGSAGSFSSLLRGEKSRSNSKQVVIKEQPFNYEEKTGKNQRSADHLMKSMNAPTMREVGTELKDVSKSLAQQYQKIPEQLSQIVNITHQTFDRDINLVEVFRDQQTNGSFHLNHADDRDEVRMRDEVSMSHDQQLLIAAIGSGFCHSRLDSGQLWGTGNNTLKHHFAASSLGPQIVENSSYRAYEEGKSDIKIIEHDYTNHGNNTTVEKFEVIREDGDTCKDSFYSPTPMGNLDMRMNSDLKKFNIDDDQYYPPAVTTPTQPNLNAQQAWFQKLQEQQILFEQQMQKENNVRIQDNQEALTIQDLQETQQNFRERAKSFRDQMISDGVQIGTANMFSNPSLENLESHPNLNDGKNGNEAYPQQNLAHVLSFSEDQQLTNLDGLNYASQGSNNAVKPTSNNRDFLLSQLSVNTQMESNPHSQLVSAENALSQLAQIKASQPPHLAQSSANTIIEMEKNYVIVQYESLLQQLSIEFQKLLAKTKETDEHLAQQEVLIASQAKIIQDKESAQYQQEQLNQQLSQQVQDLLSELEAMTVERTRRDAHDQDQSAQQEIINHQMQQLQSKIRVHESQEVCFREDIEQALNRVRQAEARLRQKEEEVYQAERDRQAMERDVHNMKEQEKALRMEIERANKDRLAQEEQIQEARQRAVADQVLVRLRENEIETLNREFKTLRSACENLQMSMSQVMRENDQLKQAINEHERNNIQMKSLFQTREVQSAQLESDANRLKTIIEKERQRANQLEEDYQKKIEQLQNELRESNLRRDADQISFRKQMEKALAEQESMAVQQRYIGDMRQSVQSFGQQQQDEQTKIQWPYAQQQKQTRELPQSVVPQVQKPIQQQIREDPVDPRQKPLNQNMSQLHDVLAWSEGSRAQGVPPPIFKSLERPSYSANMFSQFKAQQNLATNIPPSQFSPRASGGGPQPDIQAAGKRSGNDMSPFTVDPSQKQQQLSHLQNTLSSMQIDKERFENEYRKLGTSKNKQQIERKKELEFEIEVIDKNIHQIKQRLREMNAL